MKVLATMSDCGTYRYELRREWDNSLPMVLFICLNPSTADHESEDQTSRVCINYAKRWGYGSLVIANLFAFRSTDRSVLSEVVDPVGPNNDEHLIRLIAEASEVVCAWSDDGALHGRDQIVLRMIEEPKCLQKLKSGRPAHPLYKHKELKPISL